jgi:hypothetical protein
VDPFQKYIHNTSAVLIHLVDRVVEVPEVFFFEKFIYTIHDILVAADALQLEDQLIELCEITKGESQVIHGSELRAKLAVVGFLLVEVNDFHQVVLQRGFF